jgi:hypothetical protein
MIYTREIFPGIIREWDDETGIIKINGISVDSIEYATDTDNTERYNPVFPGKTEYTIIIKWTP